MSGTSPTPTRTLRLLTANIQAGSSTRRYSDYVTRSWSHALPMGRKRSSLDTIAKLAGDRDIVGLNESDPGSLRSGFTNQTHYLAERAGFDHWTHQPNRRVGNVASSANGLLSRLEPVEVVHHPLPGRIAEIMRKGDEVHVDSEEHQLDSHQQHDDVLPVKENTNHRNRKQDCAEDQIVSERQSHSVPLIVFPQLPAARHRYRDWIRPSCSRYAGGHYA